MLSIKDQIVNILGLVDHMVYVATTVDPHCSQIPYLSTC